MIDFIKKVGLILLMMFVIISLASLLVGVVASVYEAFGMVIAVFVGAIILAILIALITE